MNKMGVFDTGRDETPTTPFKQIKKKKYIENRKNPVVQHRQTLPTSEAGPSYTYLCRLVWVLVLVLVF